MRREPLRSIEGVNLADLLLQPLLAQTLRLEARLRVVGDAEVIPPQRLGRRGHFHEGVAAVRRGRVVVKRPAHIRQLHEPRQLARLRRLDLPEALAQLRRDEVQPQRREQLRLAAQFPARVLLRFFLGRPFALRRHQAPLAETEPAAERALAQLHVVVLRPGEMVQGKRKLGRRHDAQIRLQSALEAHARLRIALRRDLLHPGLRDKPVHHRREVLRRHDKIQVAHRLEPAPQAARRLGALDLGQRAQPRHDRLRNFRGLPPVVPPPVGFPVPDARDNFLLRLFAEAVELRNLARGTRLRQRRDARDPELVVQRADFLRTQSGDLQHLLQPRFNRRLQLLEKLQPARRVQLRDLLHERLAKPLDRPEFARRDQPRQFRFLDRLQRPRARLIRAHLKRVLALQLEQRPDLRQHIGNFVLLHGTS